MTNVELLFQKIDEGRSGKNIGLSTGIPKLDKYTGGIQKGVYTLIFGLSGSGKTSVALYSYIYRPLKDHPDRDLKYIYFSLELGAQVLLGKLLCLWIYEEFGVVIPYSSMMSWKEPLNDEYYKYIQKGKAWLDSISNKLLIYDKFLTARTFYSTIMSNLEEWGSFEESQDGRKKNYVKNNPEQIVSVVTDHVGLVSPEGQHTKKQEIDLLSQYAVSLRERCGVSFIMLQQENRNSASSDKIKLDMTDCSLDGLKETGNTGNDSEICIGVYNPLKFKLKNKSGYPIIAEDNGFGFTGFKERIRFLQIIKNRFGESDKSIPVNFFGEIGLFRELPKPEEIVNPLDYMSLCPNTQEIVEQDSPTKNFISYEF